MHNAFYVPMSPLWCTTHTILMASGMHVQCALYYCSRGCWSALDLCQWWWLSQIGFSACGRVPLTSCSSQAKVKVAEETERDIDATRLEYVPVAVRTQILFFCVSDLSNVDPMYQYSLEWFLEAFSMGIWKSRKMGTVPSRALPTHSTPSYIVHNLLLHRTLCSHTSCRHNTVP